MTLDHLLLNFTNSSPVELFNFSIDQAIVILEEYLLRDRIFDSTVEAIIVTFYVILMAIGIISNVVVCYVIASNTKVRSSRNLFVLNLNIADLALCTFCMPFTLLELIRRSWPLGTPMCKLVPFVQGATVFVSAATVTAIALDRHYTIVNLNPNQCRKSKKWIGLYTGAIWAISLVLSLPICLSQTVKSVGIPGVLVYDKCIEHWMWAHGKGLYTLIIMTVQYVIPATVLSVTHFKIKAHLNLSLRQLDDNSRCSERLDKELKRNRRATMVLTVIAVIFSASWLPWNAVNIIADFHPASMAPKNLYAAFAVCHIIAMTSAITNPFLYGWLNTNIRKELVRVGSTLLSMKINNSDATPNNDNNIRTSFADIDMRKSPNVEFEV